MVNELTNITSEKKERTGLIIKEKRKRLGLTLEDLAEGIGITHAYLSMVETGKRVASDMVLRMLSERLDLDYEDLRRLSEQERYERQANKIRARYFQIQGIEESKSSPIPDGIVFIPIFGMVPMEAPLSSESEAAIGVPDNWIAPTDNIFALQIRDDSMTGRLESTDFVAVRRDDTDLQNNDLVIVRLDNLITVKAIEFVGDMILLRSSNGQPETMHFTEENKDQMEIIGKVIFRVTQAS